MKPKSRGFTLIEILVVLVIVGIAVGGASAMINVGGSEQEVAEQVNALTAYSEHAAEMAVITGEPIGLVLMPPKWRQEEMEEAEEKRDFNLDDLGWEYRWMKETGVAGANGTMRRWVDIEEMEPVVMPPEINLAVSVEERLLTWDFRPDQPTPVIAFYPEGEVTPFEIEFTYDEEPETAQHIVVNIWGEIEWKEKADVNRDDDDFFQ